MPKYKKTKRLIGRVKWFDPGKGIGYITTDDGLNFFVHYSSLPVKDGHFIPLNEDQVVSFDVKQGFYGPQAVNIEILTQKLAK